MQIIDLSYNRIRRITKSELKKYTDLKILYLSDNLIGKIDDDAFEDKDDLTTLDLSLNGITQLPPIIFNLPSLKTLYLGNNSNMNIVDAVNEAKPIKSPLVKLDISYVIDDYNELPDLGIMPYLIRYNISGNKLLTLSTKHFAGLCNLQYLDAVNVTVNDLDNCDCWTVNQWLHKRKIQFTEFDCRLTENCKNFMCELFCILILIIFKRISACSNDVEISDLNIYENCKKKTLELHRKSRILKIVIPIIIVIVVILTGLVYYYMRRRKQKFEETMIPLRNT